MDETAQDSGFEKIARNLDKQNQLYERLLQLSENERDAVGRADLSAIALVISEKEHIVREAERLEKERSALMAHIAAAHSLPELPSANQLYKLAASTRYAQRMQTLIVSLSARVRQLQKVNTQNAALIEQSQRINETLLQSVLKHAKAASYSHAGGIVQEQRPSVLFDFRA